MRIQNQNNFGQNNFINSVVGKNNYSNISSNRISNKMPNSIPYKVTISEEGHQNYRDSLHNMGASDEISKETIELDRELLSKSIIDIQGFTQSDFHSKFKKLNTDTKENIGICDDNNLMKNCFTVYASMYHDIKSGYAKGSREVWTVDPCAENGFRRVTEEEELAALDSAYEFYTKVADAYINYGRNSSEIITEAANRLQSDIDQQKDIVELQRDKADHKVMKNVYKKLQDCASQWKSGYSVTIGNLPDLFHKIFDSKLVITK